MKIKADLHNHFSTLENIGEIFNQAIDVAQKNLGRDGVFAVVNAQDKGLGRYETFLGLKGYDRGVLNNCLYVYDKEIYVIKGQEVFTQGGHILVLGLSHGVRLQDYRTLEDSLKEAKDNNGIIISDHGFFLDGIFTKQSPEKYLNSLDGIEVHNGESWLPFPGHARANKKAKEFYNKIKWREDIGAISTSDGHSVNEIGLSYTELEKPDFSSPEKLIESLRRSIREHKDFSNDKQTNAYLGTLNHSAKTAGLRLASALRIIGRVN